MSFPNNSESTSQLRVIPEPRIPKVRDGAGIQNPVSIDGGTAGLGTVFEFNPAGTPNVPAATLSPSVLDFGSQTVGTSSSQSATITNTGSLDVTFEPAALTNGYGTPRVFSVNSDTCSGATLAPKATCSASFTFRLLDGSSQEAWIMYADTTGNVFLQIYMSGTGVEPLVGLSESALTFTGQLLNTTSAAKAVTLDNSGNGALIITSVAVIGDFVQTNTCGSSVAVGANCIVNVTFTPTAGGTPAGTITITDNATDSPQTISLSGTGEDFSVGPPSGGSTSATVSPGQTAAYTLSFAPMGGLSGTINFTCSGAPSEATCSVSPASVTTNGSSTTNVTVNVATTAPGMAVPGPRFTPTAEPFLLPLEFLALSAILVLWLVMKRGENCHPRESGGPFRTWIPAYAGMTNRDKGRLGHGGGTDKADFSRIRFLTLALALMLVAAIWLPSCGGGSSTTTPPNPGTPAGTYSLTVTATMTSGATTLTHNLSLTLKVQ